MHSIALCNFPGRSGWFLVIWLLSIATYAVEPPVTWDDCVGEMIRNKVIEEAKRMLYASDLSGKEIAFELGFDDPAYFSRFFKKYTGQTLKHFRDLSRKKYH